MSTTAAGVPQIHILDTGTRSKLRSTQIITSLPQIVSELVQNSLDAGAKRVEVGVDREEWGCFVRDDGSGIGKKGLEVLVGGVEGGRYGELVCECCCLLE
jgi:DNA mismatch repair protein MLH3